MKRHPVNRNLSVHEGLSFEGFPVMDGKGEFIHQYLVKLSETINFSLQQYPRVFAFRVDLRYPHFMQVNGAIHSNEAISNFLELFKAQIKAHGVEVRRLNPYAHISDVRYVWAREQGQGSPAPHYHLLILLNQDAFYTLGRLGSDSVNMISRLESAWAGALGLSLADVRGLVHIPENAQYRIHRDEHQGQAALFERASYLCKVATKPFGNGYHVFDCSRN